MSGKQIIAAAVYDRLVAAINLIEGGLKPLAEGNRELLAVQKELRHEAYRIGGARALDDLNRGFSDVVIRDRLASALFQAGMGEVLDVGSNRDHSVASFAKLLERFAPGNEFTTARTHAPPPGTVAFTANEKRSPARDHRGRVIGQEANREATEAPLGSGDLELRPGERPIVDRQGSKS